MAKDHERQQNLDIADTGGKNCPGSPKVAEMTTEAAKMVLAPLDRNVGTRARETQTLFRAC